MHRIHVIHKIKITHFNHHHGIIIIIRIAILVVIELFIPCIEMMFGSTLVKFTTIAEK